MKEVSKYAGNASRQSKYKHRETCRHNDYKTRGRCDFYGAGDRARALIQAGIKEVYIGAVDPDLRNNGRGIELLKESGVKVHVGLLHEKIVKELRDYLGRAP